MVAVANSIRSNLLLDVSVHDFIKTQSRNRGVTKGQLVGLAIKALKRTELKKQIKGFYANIDAKREDMEMAEESFIN